MLRILTYHRVLDPSEPGHPRLASISATPATFERQMRYISARYRVLSAAEVLAAARGDCPLPSRAVLITFDDAYHDFRDVIWPILQRLRLPATLFVPTAYPDNPQLEFWWDRLHRVFGKTSQSLLRTSSLGSLPLSTAAERGAALRLVERELKSTSASAAARLIHEVCGQLGDEGPSTSLVLGWSDLRGLARDGVTLAPHTQTHPVLSRLSTEQVRAEVRGSLDDLKRRTGEVAPIFAYPFGAYNAAVVQILKEEGVELAVTCRDGHNKLPATDPLQLCRTNITLRTSALVFRARLHPVMAHVDRWRHREERSVLGTPR